MIDSPPVQTFDLPTDCQYDHVVIRPNDAPKDPPFSAIPFNRIGEDDTDNTHYQEPDNFEVTEVYREAVVKMANMDIEDVKLRRDELPTDQI